jgi:HK97 family phage portal protein
MGWNPFRRSEKALTATPAVLESVRDGWSPYPLLGGGARQRILDTYNTAKSANYQWMYRQSPAVRVVIDCLVRNIGQLDLRLYEEISEAEREPRPDHPAALSLRYPNETTTGAKFRRSLFKDFLINDDAFSLMLPASGNQLVFQWVPTHRVEIRGSSMWTAEGYRVWRRDGTFVDFDPDQILHWHGENPDDPRTGLSHLETLRDVIAEDAALQQAIVELANSGMTEPAWVFRPGDAPQWDNDDRKGFEQDLTNRLRRRNRTPVVLEEGMEMRSFGVSPKDAEMMEVRRWAISQIAREYGVPLGMVGLADDVEQARSQFYADTLPPYCEDFTTTLNQRVLVRAYNWTDGCFEFNLDEKHMGDDRLKALVSATGRPVMLTNEARAKINLPPVDGGDELVTPQNVTVGEKPSVDVMPVQDPNKPEQDGSYRTEQPKALTKAEEFEPLPQLHPGRKGDLDRQHRNIDLAQAAVERHFTRLHRALRADERRKSATDWSRWDQEFTKDINRVVEDIVEREGTIYAFKLGGTFDMGRVTKYLQAMSEGVAEGINGTIRDEITELGLDGALARRAQHVESAGAGLGAGATRWAREEAARQSPGTENRVKTWIPHTKRHAQFGGQTVPLGADWPAGFAPGSAPGCRCTQAID